MLISEAISLAEHRTGQVVEQALQLRWLSTLDGQIALEFYGADAWTAYGTDDLSCELLIPLPWDIAYSYYISALTYHTNGEYDRYANEWALFESELEKFKRFVRRTNDPVCKCLICGRNGGTDVTIPTGCNHGRMWYLSAYALACKHGFAGTPEEWLDSLVGPPGADGEDGVDGTVSWDELTPEQQASLKGPKGDKGDKGDTGATGPAGQNGTNGTNGTNGQDGFSPIASVSKVGDTATITITDKIGTTTATVKDGVSVAYQPAASQVIYTWARERRACEGTDNPSGGMLRLTLEDNGSESWTLQYADSFKVETGFVLESPTSHTGTWTAADAQTALRGKYVGNSSSSGTQSFNVIYYIPADAVITGGTNSGAVLNVSKWTSYNINDAVTTVMSSIATRTAHRYPEPSGWGIDEDDSDVFYTYIGEAVTTEVIAVPVLFWIGTQAEYDALTAHDPNVQYIIVGATV
ncbi:MAG: collagen-like protein [Ruminococcaceae bacterium]|nr:collagen-like protein [Oscillospiraceae bacterium]